MSDIGDEILASILKGVLVISLILGVIIFGIFALIHYIL